MEEQHCDWDGVWNAASHVNDEGWVAEIAIPFSTLRFNPELDTWGLNVRRSIRRKNEEVFWSPIGLDADLIHPVCRGVVLHRPAAVGVGLRARVADEGALLAVGHAVAVRVRVERVRLAHGALEGHRRVTLPGGQAGLPRPALVGVDREAHDGQRNGQEEGG